MASNNKDWWKIIAALAAVAGFIVGAIGIWPEPGPDVQAHVSHHIQQYPPGIQQVIAPFDYGTSAVPYFGPAHDSLIAEAYPDSLLLDKAAYEAHEELWVIAVRNEGEATADSVILQMPRGDYYTVRLEGQGERYGPTGDRIIEVGAILPGQSATVMVWSSIATSYWTDAAEDIIVSYSGRLGEVDYDRPVGGLFQWLSANPWASLPIFALAFIMFLGIIMSAIDDLFGLPLGASDNDQEATADEAGTEAAGSGGDDPQA